MAKNIMPMTAILLKTVLLVTNTWQTEFMLHISSFANQKLCEEATFLEESLFHFKL